jgi:hypothetical protein
MQLQSSQNAHVISHSTSDCFYTLPRAQSCPSPFSFSCIDVQKGLLSPTLAPNNLKEWPSHWKRLAHNHALQIVGDGAEYCKNAWMSVWQSWETTHQFVCSSLHYPWMRNIDRVCLLDKLLEPEPLHLALYPWPVGPHCLHHFWTERFRSSQYVQKSELHNS